jgi:hypothetical protein
MVHVDQREFSRVRLIREIKVTCEGSLLGDCQLRDISLGNAFLSVPEAASIGLSRPLHLEIEIMTQDGPLHVDVDAETARLERHGMAVRFTEIDVDSLNDLYSLLLMYLGSEDLLRDELFGKNCQSGSLIPYC